MFNSQLDFFPHSDHMIYSPRYLIVMCLPLIADIFAFLFRFILSFQ